MSNRNPPPPPILTDRSRGRYPNSRHDQHDRARSRSPLQQHRSFGSSRFHDERARPSSSSIRNRNSPHPYERKPTASSSKMTMDKLPTSNLIIGSAFGIDPKLLHTPSVSRVVATISDRETIVRRILAPENVLIPRHPGEGVRPIFEREELREGIERRRLCGDNDVNPGVPEQRVIAIIREPMLPEHYSIQPAPAAPEVPERQKTSTGMTYRLKPSTSSYPSSSSANRSRSLEKSYDQDRRRPVGLPHGSEVSSQSRDRRSPHHDSGPRVKLENRESRRERAAKRRSRSRSVTPPPMPPSMQRNLQNNRRGGFTDFKIPVSRRSNDDDRETRDTSFRGRGSSRIFRNSRGFQQRGFGGRGRWQHDMYDRASDDSSDLKRSSAK